MPCPWGCDDGRIYWTASYSNVGVVERNEIVVRGTGSAINFNDLLRKRITAGAHCRSLAVNVASCSWPCSQPYACVGPYLVAVSADLGPGDDSFLIAPGIGNAPPAWVEGGEGNDVIRGGGGDGDTNPDRLSGGPGNDVIYVTAYQSIVSCGSGVDTVVVSPLLYGLTPQPAPPDCEVVLQP